MGSCRIAEGLPDAVARLVRNRRDLPGSAVEHLSPVADVIRLLAGDVGGVGQGLDTRGHRTYIICNQNI